MKTEEELATEAAAAAIETDENGTNETDETVLEDNDDEDSEANSADDKSEKTIEEDEDDGEPLTLNLGDDEDEEIEDTEANSTIRQMRAKLRAEERERKRLQAELDAKKANPEAKADGETELGPKPTLEDFDYDDEEYEASLLKWHDTKKKVEAAQKEQEEKRKAQTEEWSKRVKSHEDRRAEMIEHPEYEDAEAVVIGGLSENQQYMAVRALKDAPKMFLALGKHPARLKKLAGITDEVDFIAAIVREEAAMKITGKRAERLKPETRLQGGAAPAGGSDATLKRLEAEADRTGDRTKVQAFKRSLREKS